MYVRRRRERLRRKELGVIRSGAGKVVWVGRATVFLLGLAVILALLFGAATAALGADGKPLLLGKASNTAFKVTGLVKGGAHPPPEGRLRPPWRSTPPTRCSTSTPTTSTA